MKNKKQLVKSVLLGMAMLFILSACQSSANEALPLAAETYTHPSGIFTIPIPEGWQTEVDAESPDVVWLTPPAGGPDVTIVMIAEVLPGENEEEMNAAAQVLLEDYLTRFLPYTDYEIYNSAEVRVAKNPAMILDIARPLGDSYHVGRMELVYLPGHLVYLAGFGPREAWDPFLPTFRQMVEGMSFYVEALTED
ncbi:MAG: hypothetical protein H0S79_19880 [Anaerolineaceae bacterium]|nr:hypothetical protein [Anaerolineaceae bacterium]